MEKLYALNARKNSTTNWVIKYTDSEYDIVNNIIRVYLLSMS